MLLDIYRETSGRLLDTQCGCRVGVQPGDITAGELSIDGI
jgi:hypothetical protein